MYHYTASMIPVTQRDFLPYHSSLGCLCYNASLNCSSMNVSYYVLGKITIRSTVPIRITTKPFTLTIRHVRLGAHSNEASVREHYHTSHFHRITTLDMYTGEIVESQVGLIRGRVGVRTLAATALEASQGCANIQHTYPYKWSS